MLISNVRLMDAADIVTDARVSQYQTFEHEDEHEHDLVAARPLCLCSIAQLAYRGLAYPLSAVRLSLGLLWLSVFRRPADNRMRD